MKSKLPTEDFSKLPPETQKYILQLEANNLALSKQNDLFQENFGGLKEKTEIIKQINFLSKTKEERYNNLHFYEEGKIAALLWILGLNETTDIEELVKNV